MGYLRMGVKGPAPRQPHTKVIASPVPGGVFEEAAGGVVHHITYTTGRVLHCSDDAGRQPE